MTANPWDLGGTRNPEPAPEPEPSAPPAATAIRSQPPAPIASSTPAPSATTSQPPAAEAVQLTPTQRRVFDELLSIGAERPVMRPNLIEELEERITTRTADAVKAWTEPSVFISKGPLFSTLRCEGLVLADEANRPDFTKLHPKAAVGIVAHRAIETAHVTPGHPSRTYVDWALNATVRAEERFRNFWEAADPGERASLTMEMVSKTNYYLTSFPPLDAAWDPRFEESVAAKVGKVRLSAKLDLVIGNPRASGKQTMFLCDLKTGSLGDHHADEATFCALVVALRHRVAPFRSVVYSLSEGEWTEPDITEERLFDAADKVILAVNTRVELLTEQRGPVFSPGRHCSFCPVKDTCPESETRQQAA